MKLYSIQNTKLFMSKLLAPQDSIFDKFLLKEAQIHVGITYTIDGKLNLDFYSDDELMEMESNAIKNNRVFSKDYIRFEQVKGYIYDIIKGKNTPLSFKLVLEQSGENLVRFMQSVNTSISVEEINSLNLILKYDGSSITCTTAVSLKIFTMDKSVENAWDDMIQKFLLLNGIDIEIA